MTEAFGAYVELLTTGRTQALQAYSAAPAAPRSAVPALAGAGAGAGAVDAVRSRPSRAASVSVPPSHAGQVLGLGTAVTRLPARDIGAALNVVVVNSDLKFIRQPLLVGHYRALTLTGAEAVIDGLLGGAMGRSLAAGLYPDAPGSHQVFGNRRPNPDNPFEMARPGAAIVVGLGDEGQARRRVACLRGAPGGAGLRAAPGRERGWSVGAVRGSRPR